MKLEGILHQMEGYLDIDIVLYDNITINLQCKYQLNLLLMFHYSVPDPHWQHYHAVFFLMR